MKAEARKAANISMAVTLFYTTVKGQLLSPLLSSALLKLGMQAEGDVGRQQTESHQFPLPFCGSLEVPFQAV